MNLITNTISILIFLLGVSILGYGIYTYSNQPSSNIEPSFNGYWTTNVNPLVNGLDYYVDFNGPIYSVRKEDNLYRFESDRGIQFQIPIEKLTDQVNYVAVLRGVPDHEATSEDFIEILDNWVLDELFISARVDSEFNQILEVINITYVPHD